MNFEVVPIKSHGGSGHIQPPNPSALTPNVLARNLPILLKICNPLAQREVVVLAQRLQMANLEAVGLEERHQHTNFMKLAVGKNVALYEGTLHL